MIEIVKDGDTYYIRNHEGYMLKINSDEREPFPTLESAIRYLQTMRVKEWRLALP